MFNSAFAAFVTLTYATTVVFAIIFYAVGSMRRLAYRHYIRNYRKKSVAFSNLSHAQVLAYFKMIAVKTIIYFRNCTMCTSLREEIHFWFGKDFFFLRLKSLQRTR